MPLYTIGHVYQLTDFDTSGGNVTPPDERGADADGNPPFNIRLNPNYTRIEIIIQDDDPNFQETNNADSNQFLAQDVVIDGVTYLTGQRVVLNYELADDNGFLGYSITILPFGDQNTGRNETTAFVTTEPMVPGQTYTYTSEGNIGGGAGRPYENFVCFTVGGLIDTPDGCRPIETLQPGGHVLTYDRGAQPVQWIGTRTVAGFGRLAPVEIPIGMFGASRSHRVSPQHRIMLSGAWAEMLVGEPEVLASAIHLADGDRVRQLPAGFVTYVHLATDAHDLVCVDGVWSETLMVGPASLARLTDAHRAEITLLFPDAPEHPAMDIARPQLKRFEARLVA